MAAAKIPGAGDCGDGTLAMTRRRSAHIDRLVDMIPARFYLSGDCVQVLQSQQRELDPARLKTTSQMVADAAKLSGSEKAASSSGASRNNTGKKRKLGGGGANGNTSAAATASLGNSKEELRKKLEQRISELREERRRKQSENDKAKAAAVRSERGQQGHGQATNGKTAQFTDSSGPPADDIEIGRLSYDPSTAELPFQSDVARKGSKLRKRQEALRQEETNQRRLREAKSQGENVEDLRKEIFMKKALKRAGGEKVHDDISKLRKAQKHWELRKARSSEKWKQRKDDLKSQQDDRQSQRKENLKKRTDNKKKNKNWTRSGFEGKRSGYVNKGKES